METQNKKPMGLKFIGDMRLNMTGPALAWLVTKSEKAYDGKFDMIQTVAGVTPEYPFVVSDRAVPRLMAGPAPRLC